MGFRDIVEGHFPVLCLKVDIFFYFLEIYYHSTTSIVLYRYNNPTRCSKGQAYVSRWIGKSRVKSSILEVNLVNPLPHDTAFLGTKISSGIKNCEKG